MGAGDFAMVTYIVVNLLVTLLSIRLRSEQTVLVAFEQEERQAQARHQTLALTRAEAAELLVESK